VPAKLFQISTRRLIGHAVAVLASSFSVANATTFVAAGAASTAVMLLSVSNAESSFMRRGPLKRPATPLSLPAELAGAIVWNFA